MQIENDYNVYVLGAGFSRQCGLQVIADFMTQMRDARHWLSAPTDCRSNRELESLHRTGSQQRLKLPGAKWLARTMQLVSMISPTGKAISEATTVCRLRRRRRSKHGGGPQATQRQSAASCCI